MSRKCGETWGIPYLYSYFFFHFYIFHFLYVRLYFSMPVFRLLLG